MDIVTQTDSSTFLATYLPYLLHRADALMSRRFQSELHSLGLHVSEWRVLAVLHRRGPSSIGRLADDTMLPQPTVTHAVGRLEEQGDVERKRSEVDGRQRIAALTEAGVARASELAVIARAQEEAVLAAAGMGRHGDGLRRLLTDLIERLEAPGT